MENPEDHGFGWIALLVVWLMGMLYGLTAVSYLWGWQLAVFAGLLGTIGLYIIVRLATRRRS